TKTPANLTLRFVHKVNNEFVSIRAQIDDTKSNCRIEKSTWTKYKKYTKGTKYKDIDLLKELEALDTELKSLEKHVLSASESAKELTRDWLASVVKNYYNPHKEQEIPTTLLAYFDYYLEVRKSQLQKNIANWKKHVSIRNMVSDFIKDHIKQNSLLDKDIQIINVDETFMHRWSDYGEVQMYESSTIKKSFNLIKTVLRHASNTNGLELHRGFYSLKMKLETDKQPKIWLSFDELKKIAAVTGLNDNQETARDWLIISCYTGQRVSDFLRFNESMIKNKGKGLSFTQVKTRKQITVPILPEVKSILDKREGKFPKRLTDQKYNVFIKEVCRIARINKMMKGKVTKVLPDGKIRGVAGTYPKYELITSHVGRRSFATNYYGKVPTAYIRTVTGHATEAMLLEYIGENDPDTDGRIFDAFTQLK
ncbi:MAG TPA: tyrosine-type recombinase/integrase, partial [Treponemataceae bacterium]|nr:tyrosine-type recombinase/integrase [Treponemataceae bacterium]